jgi:hypothetical protein
MMRAAIVIATSVGAVIPDANLVAQSSRWATMIDSTITDGVISVAGSLAVPVAL